MEATQSYQVVYRGELREGFTQSQVRQALSEKLKLPAKQLEVMFSGRPVVLKRTGSANDAKKMVAGLASLGAVARIQAAGKAQQAANQPAPAEDSGDPTIELPRFSPFPKGPVLTMALILAGATEAFFALLYVLLLITFSLGLLYVSLFSTWASAVTSFGPMALLLQLIVLPPGILVLFLLAKPLWSFNPGHYRGIVVSDEQEQQLHAFVTDICERISTPPPAEIRITNNTEVELGYLNGAHGFFRNRHVLTIGAPLVAVTTTRQLAALIAQSLRLLHSKSLSPRAAYLLSRSDSWLQRAIYGKDRIDRKLENLVAEGSIYAPLVRPLQKVIAVSRRVLGWRLQASRLLNRRLMHRLVADADKVSLVFAGSDGFQKLIEQQRLLAFASQNILPGLMERWRKEGTLPDNLMQAMATRCRQYPAEIHQKLRLMQERQKEESNDIVPADSQRLRRVSNQKVAAAFEENSAASSLFRSFTKLSKSMTLRLYYNRLCIPVSPDHLVPASAPSKAMLQQQKQIDAIFRQLYLDLLPLKLSHRITMVGNFNEAAALRNKALQEIKISHSHTGLTHKRCVENEHAVVDITTQELLYRADLWKRWGMQPESKRGLDHIHQACREQEKGLDENLGLLAQQLKPHVQVLAIPLALLESPEGQRLDKGPALASEVKTLVAAFERIEHAAPQLRSLRLHCLLQRILLSYDAGRNGKLQERIQEQSGDIRQLLAGLGAGFKTTPYPFGDSHKNLMDFALHNAYLDETPEGELDRASDVVEQIIRVQRHILARLCAISMHTEKALGIS